MRDIQSLQRLHEEAELATIVSIEHELAKDGWPEWLRKNLADALEKSSPALLEDAVWHDKTAVAHLIASRTLKAYVRARDARDTDKLARLENAMRGGYDRDPVKVSDR